MYGLTFAAVHGYVHEQAFGYCVPYAIAALYVSTVKPIEKGSQPELDSPGNTNPTGMYVYVYVCIQ